MQNFDAFHATALWDGGQCDAKNTAAKAKAEVSGGEQSGYGRCSRLKTSLSQIQFFVSSVNQYTAGVQTAARTVPLRKDGSAQWLQAPRPCMTA